MYLRVGSKMADEKNKSSKIDYLKLSTSILSAAGNYTDAVNAKTSGRFAAQQYGQNARTSLRQGDIVSANIRQAGRSAEADATSAMVAQGGIVDSAMLAKIKTKSTIASLNALYDAKADARTSEFAAKAAKLQGDQAYRAGMLKVGMNIVGATSSFLGPSGSPKARRPPSPYGGR